MLAACDAQMRPADDRRLSELLYQQQARLLGPAEKAELAGLMEVYQTRLLLKARAIQEAVTRGLMPPPDP